MTLEYKSANRITGNSTDNLVTPTFEDFFTTDTNWTIQGSDHSINTTTERIVFSSIRSGIGNPNGVTADLTSASDTAWTMRFKVNIDTVTLASAGNIDMYVGLFSSDTAGLDDTQDGIAIRLGVGTADTRIHGIAVDGASWNTVEDSAFTLQLAEGDELYIEIKRLTATTFWIGIYNDSSFSELIEEHTGECASTTQTLRYIGLKTNDLASVTGELAGFIDNIQFWDGVEKTPTFQDDFNTDDWTQVGTALVIDETTDERVEFTNMPRDAEHRLYYDLGATVSEDAWQLDFKINFDLADNGTPSFGGIWVGLTDDTTWISGVGNDFAGINIFDNVDSGVTPKMRMKRYDEGTLTAGTNSTTTFSENTDYWITIKREGTTLRGFVYSDANRTTLVEALPTLTVATTIDNLRYLQITSQDATDNGQISGHIDDLKFWDNTISSDAPADTDSKPYEVPTFGTFDELDTAERKTYYGNKNYVKLGTRFDSYYQHRSPFSILQKQHFWEFFSGKQISSIWSFTDHAGSNSGAMADEINGGFTITTGTVTNNVRTYHFNDKRQYNFDGCRIISTTKLGTATSVIGVVGTDNVISDDYFYMGNWSSTGNNNMRLLTHDSTSGTSTDTGVASNTSWRLNVGEMTPTNALYSLDGILEITKTANLPTLKHQPRLRCDTETGSARTLSIGYYEVFNT